MLKLNLARLMKLHEVFHPLPYLTRHGFSEHEARGLLSDGKVMLRVEHLTKLCLLFNCTPNDLFDWNGDEHSKLAELKKVAYPEITQVLARKSPTEIEEIIRKVMTGEI